jgi:hypothetical protein
VASKEEEKHLAAPAQDQDEGPSSLAAEQALFEEEIVE